MIETTYPKTPRLPVRRELFLKYFENLKLRNVRVNRDRAAAARFCRYSSGRVGYKWTGAKIQGKIIVVLVHGGEKGKINGEEGVK